MNNPDIDHENLHVSSTWLCNRDATLCCLKKPEMPHIEKTIFAYAFVHETVTENP